MANFDPPKIRTKKQASLEKIFNSLINLFVFEKIAKTIQIALMKKRLGKEITRDDVLAFHPYDFGQKIIEKYESIITYTRGH
ncbi:MAG: hypothetical protein HYV38_02465 [Candidatus Levybacteria bacterium]|nr:hypothetical protein [Candidatus Levybacteria bacterium]